MANPAINRVQGECGCGGARFLHQRCEIPGDFESIKAPIPALFRRYQFYDVYVCENCGHLEFFLAKGAARTQKYDNERPMKDLKL
jgi:predicted nucleic-acid-binding Zn-ribbon protein